MAQALRNMPTPPQSPQFTIQIQRSKSKRTRASRQNLLGRCNITHKYTNKQTHTHTDPIPTSKKAMLLPRRLHFQARARPRLVQPVPLPPRRLPQRPRFSSTEAPMDTGNPPPPSRSLGRKGASLGVQFLGLVLLGGALYQILPDSFSKDDTSRRVFKAVPDLDKQQPPSAQIKYTTPPTDEEVTAQLNEHAFSVRLLQMGEDIWYDGAQLASNSPCEDAFLHGSFSSRGREHFGGKLLSWAVFDGHCGWQLSKMLTTQLIPFVRQSLQDTAEEYAASGTRQVPEEEYMQRALKRAFTNLDDAIVKSAQSIIDDPNLSFAEKARRLEPAYAGACALLALFDRGTRKLTVASTGDCRAVMGQRRQSSSASTSTSESQWQATDLSQDCTGATPSEIERIKAQFPDEPDVVQGGRIWGLQPSRTFGDGMWKWSADLKKKLRWEFNGLSLPSATRYKGYKEGPYVTAEPLVTTTHIPKAGQKGDNGEVAGLSFVILATDGLWDTMSSQDAVDLVGRWWEKQRYEKDSPEKKTATTATDTKFGPVILGWKQQCKYEPRKATFCDTDNAAVHLIRNGLGGADDEMVRGALSFRYPNSRDIRDDITVQVIFFGQRTW
ncbi:phosphatase 2C-like domain-containing protein [Xylariaceae sp. FL0255]|nr:phosphatase 2C-like domain-containing protein [Xylariaceae sp. FL0255]